MKTKLSLGLILLAFAITGAWSARADDLSALAGRWVSTRTDNQGRSGKVTLDIQQARFTFKIEREGQVFLYAEGDVKVETAAGFKTAKFHNIRGGRSADDLQAVDDERAVVYRLSGDELYVASGFDRERSETPSVMKYTRAPAEARTLVIDKIEMHQKLQDSDWYFCFEATVDGVTKRFNVPNKVFNKNELTIETDLSLPNVKAGQTCKFVMKMDDVPGDECTEEMDNRSAGSFTVSESGSQEFKPENAWRYTIHWHLK
jgi:hypothetical protein